MASCLWVKQVITTRYVSYVAPKLIRGNRIWTAGEVNSFPLWFYSSSYRFKDLKSFWHFCLTVFSGIVISFPPSKMTGSINQECLKTKITTSFVLLDNISVFVTWVDICVCVWTVGNRFLVTHSFDAIFHRKPTVDLLCQFFCCQWD